MRLSPKSLVPTFAALAILLSAPSCTDRSRSYQPPLGLAAESYVAERRPSPSRSLAAADRSAPDRRALRNEVRRAPRTSRSGTYRPPRGQGFDSYPPRRSPRDTWEQVRLLMSVVPARPEVSSLREFRRKLRRYHGNQRFFDQLGKKAAPWLYHVTGHLEARGMPGELALLPAVESGYDSAAVSSQNAAGLWQILPSTARDLKLPRSRWYDGRYDVPAATPAALDYLAYLRTAFNGDWVLSVAAYNCGPGNVRRAIRRAGLEVETASYPAIERYLPRETRDHVARWLVLSEIVATPRLHKVRLEAIPRRPYFAEVSTSRPIDLTAAAKITGLPLSTISYLNSGLTQGVVAPEGPHRLLIPASHSARFNGRVGELSSSGTALAAGDRQRYRIRAGDTLSSIAFVHGTTVRVLMAANDLDSHLIRAGRHLWVPATNHVRTEEPGAVATHVVNPGESLWLIAKRYRTTVGSLRNWNLLVPGSDLLRPGQKLRILREG